MTDRIKRREEARKAMAEIRRDHGNQILKAEELAAADEEHALAHEALRRDFETLLRQAVDGAKKGEDVEDTVAALYEAYNASSRTNVRLMSVVRRLNNSRLKETVL